MAQTKADRSAAAKKAAATRKRNQRDTFDDGRQEPTHSAGPQRSAARGGQEGGWLRGQGGRRGGQAAGSAAKQAGKAAASRGTAAASRRRRARRVDAPGRT